MTRSERRVWFWLRRHCFAGFKFRRQHPIDRYFLDFYCPELRFAIELDGTGHDHPEQAHHDARRSRDLAMRGIHVMRLRNEIVLENPDGAWQMIAMAAARIIAASGGRAYDEVLKSLLTESDLSAG